MVNRLVYPSEDFPNPVPFVLAVPDNWLAVHVSGTLMAACAPSAEDGFDPNVTVSWQRVALTATAQAVAETLLGSLEETGELSGLDLEPEFDGSVAVVSLESASPDGPITQRSLIVVGPPTSPRTRDVFHVVGSHDAKRSEDGEQIREILSSFSFIDLAALAAAE